MCAALRGRRKKKELRKREKEKEEASLLSLSVIDLVASIPSAAAAHKNTQRTAYAEVTDLT